MGGRNNPPSRSTSMCFVTPEEATRLGIAKWSRSSETEGQRENRQGMPACRWLIDEVGS